VSSFEKNTTPTGLFEVSQAAETNALTSFKVDQMQFATLVRQYQETPEIQSRFMKMRDVTQAVLAEAGVNNQEMMMMMM
jgi:hypothetical protein